VIRGIIFLVVAGALVWCGATVKLGKKTTFGHIQSIWKSEATQDMVEGVKEKAGPLVDKAKRGVEAGVREAAKDEKAPAPAAPKPEAVTPAPDAGTAAEQPKTAKPGKSKSKSKPKATTETATPAAER
jgi:hypothetical protein